MEISEYLNSKGFEWKRKDRGGKPNAIMNCPFCSDKEKKFAVNLDHGAFQCFHFNRCGIKGSFWDLQKKLGDKPQPSPAWRPTPKVFVPQTPKTYVKPVVKVSKLSPKHIQYLEGRGLSKKTIEFFKIGEKQGAMAFPYFKNKEVVGIKYRALPKKFWNEKDSEPVLFNRDNIKPDEKILLICEGECFPGDAEILTESGWERFDQYQGGNVVQYYEDKTAAFVKPIAFIKKKYDRELVRNEVKGYLSVTTPEHSLVSIDYRGRLRKHPAKKRVCGTDRIPRTAVMNGKGIKLSKNQIALCLAVSADATIDYRKNNGYNGRIPKEKRYVRFGLKKDRKIKRLTKILSALKIEASINRMKNGYMSICFSIPNWVIGKKFPFQWIVDATEKQRNFIIEELTYWDGNFVRDRQQTEFSSKHYINAVWVQTLCHTAGRVSTIMKRKNQFGEWYKVSLLHNKQFTSWQAMKTTNIPYQGNVYCVSVPTGMILVRQENKITISGNCDCMTMHEYGIDSVSVPNGSQDFRWLDNEWEWLQKFDGFHLCFDNDSAGIKGAENLAQKLGAWKCQRVILPFKDANECLKNKITAEVITDCLWEAIDFAPTDLVSPERFTDEIIQLIENPQLLNGTPTAWPKLNSLLGGWRMSELTVWSGQNGSGKSTIINQQVLDLLGKNNGVCIASLEMTPARYLRWMLLQKTHKQYPTADEVKQALTWMSDNLYLINSTDSMDVDVLLDIFKYAARRYNVKHFVIDSLMRINISGDDKWDAQKEFVAKLLTFGKKFQTHMHLVAHARKLGSDNDKPDKTAVKGSGDITDLAHNVLVMWRTPEDSRVDVDAVLSVRKNRELGLLGNVGLYFNPQTKSFYDEMDKYEKTKQNTRRLNNSAPI